MELLLGCGRNRDKKVVFSGTPREWTELVTLDMDPSVGADVVHDLNVLPYPFDDSAFDEIHAYDVLEHCGRQGDYQFFFDQFAEFWRILKPDGYLVAIVPMWDSPWAWGDPGHTRVIPKEGLIFLNQQEYSQSGETAMTDYRPYYKADFVTVAVTESDHRMGFVLKARK